MFHVFHLDVAKLVGMLHIYASVLGVFIRMLQVFHFNNCIGLQWLHACFQVFQVFCKCFRHTLQGFQLFWTYVVNVSSGCCKSRLGVAHVAICVRSGGGREWSLWRSLAARETRARVEACWSEHGKRSATRSYVRALALLL
jgi:hypothetical protein